MPLDSLAPGADVRVTAPAHQLTRAPAVFGGFGSEGLFLRLEAAEQTVILPRPDISELLVVQRSSFAIPGLLMGTALGAAATAGIMSGFADQSFAESLPILGGGALFGLLVGSALHRTVERRVDLSGASRR